MIYSVRLSRPFNIVSWNRNDTPESDEEKKKYEMISDVMGTPRNKSSSRMEDMD